MKMLTSKIISFILVLSMILGMGTTAFANGSEINVIPKDIEQGDVIVTDEGVYINGHYYTQGEFIKLLDTTIEIESPEGGITTQSAAALIAGTWWIPGIGEVVITAAGTIIIAGAVIKSGTWLYNTIVDWFVTRAEIKDAKSKIPSRIKDKNGEVDLGHFNNKVKGRTAYKEKGGWEIDKDYSGHKGSKWKLKDKSGKRVASLDEKGKVVGK